jgi:hypothetical protein
LALLLAAAGAGGAARASVLDSWIGPHQMRLIGNGTEIEYVGGIAGSAVAELARLLDANPRVLVLQLTSQGGDTLIAMGMEQLVRQHRLITYVPRFCVSACAFVFLGGRERYVGPGARLGFHAAMGLDESPEATDRLASAARSWMLERGVAAVFADRAVTTPSRAIWFPTASEMARAGVLTAAVSPRAFAPPSFGRGMPSLVRTTATLSDPSFVATKALIVAIKRADPPTFDAMQASLDGAIRSGTYDPAISRSVSSHVTQLIQRAVAVASDASVAEFAAARSEEMDRLGAIDPAVCLDLPSVTDAQREAAEAALPTEINLRQIKALAEVLNSSIDRPQPPPSRSEAKAIYDTLMRTMARELGDDMQYLVHPDLRPATTCALRNAIMKAMLSLPPPRRSVLLRAVMSGRL